MEETKKPNKVLKTVLFSPRQLEMITDIMTETGSDNFSGNVHFCISQQWKRMFPAYVRNVTDPETIEKKAISKAKSKEAVTKMVADEKRNKKIAYCENVMRGRVEGDRCVYKQWGPRIEHDSEESCTLNSLEDIITENDLFYPDKDTVLANRKDVKKVYEISN